MTDMLDLAHKVGETLKSRKLIPASPNPAPAVAFAARSLKSPALQNGLIAALCRTRTHQNRDAEYTRFLNRPTWFMSVKKLLPPWQKAQLPTPEAHVALSTTGGIAGPTGAVPGKPVSTVCFGWRVGGCRPYRTQSFSRRSP